MSIGSLQTNPMVNPWTESVASQSGSTAAWSAMSCDATGTSSSQGGTAAASNPFQNLASDIQAMLIQAQGSTTTPDAASGAGAAGSTTGVTLEQQLATDLQSMMNDLQGATTQTSTTQTSTTQTANANPADSTGQAQPHHHHHHHGDGGGDEASGATAVAGNSTSPGTATSADDEATAQIFAADITQALAAYGGNMGTAVTPALIV